MPPKIPRQTYYMPTEEEDREITAAALADPDAQPMTDEELDSLVPYKVYLRGRPKLANKKQLVSVRYSPEVLQWFRATGPGWQARMDEALKAHFQMPHMATLQAGLKSIRLQEVAVWRYEVTGHSRLM